MSNNKYTYCQHEILMLVLLERFNLDFLLKFISLLPFLFVSSTFYPTQEKHFQELFLNLFLINIPIILLVFLENIFHRILHIQDLHVHQKLQIKIPHYQMMHHIYERLPILIIISK